MPTKSPAPTPAISVLLINKRERGIRDTLRLIGEQVISESFEVIVVDASLGELDDIYQDFPAVRVIPFESSSKRVTIPEQRNLAIREARAKIVVFIDAGCYPESDWLDQLTRPLLREGELIAAGATLSAGKPTFHDDVHASLSDKRYINQAPTINLALSKQVFEQIGWFDERLLYGSDFDFTWRANQAGIKIYNAHAAKLTHDWGGLRQELKRAYRYGQAKTKLYLKHRPGWRTFLAREFALVFYAVYLLGLPLALLFPGYLLLMLVPVIKNLRRPSQLTLIPINLVTAAAALRELALGGRS